MVEYFAAKMFFCKCEQTSNYLQIWPHLLENISTKKKKEK